MTRNPVTPTEVRQTLRPGQTVRIELASTPRARHSIIALNNLFRRSPEVAERWNEHNGEPRMRETMKIPRVHPNRRRVRNTQRRQLLVGAACEIPNIGTSHINDIASVSKDVKVTVVNEGSDRKPFVVGLGK
jgi:hypothetical protein